MTDSVNQIIDLEEKLGIQLITPELQALSCLYDYGAMPSQRLFSHMRTSPAGFHIVRARLVGKKLISSTRSTVDRRQVLYDLTPGTRQQIDQLLVNLLHNLVPPAADRAGQEP